ncbi:MAG: hypothetical protein P4L22_03340 [Candidatus Babeliales bacterium]|nr:hypothetical protein [Candidatus Babeliales bacterium]
MKKITFLFLILMNSIVCIASEGLFSQNKLAQSIPSIRFETRATTCPSIRFNNRVTTCPLAIAIRPNGKHFFYFSENSLNCFDFQENIAKAPIKLAETKCYEVILDASNDFCACVVKKELENDLWLFGTENFTKFVYESEVLFCKIFDNKYCVIICKDRVLYIIILKQELQGCSEITIPLSKSLDILSDEGVLKINSIFPYYNGNFKFEIKDELHNLEMDENGSINISFKNLFKNLNQKQLQLIFMCENYHKHIEDALIDYKPFLDVEEIFSSLPLTIQKSMLSKQNSSRLKLIFFMGLLKKNKFKIATVISLALLVYKIFKQYKNFQNKKMNLFESAWQLSNSE